MPRALLALSLLALVACAPAPRNEPPPLSPRANLSTTLFVRPQAEFADLWSACRSGKPPRLSEQVAGFFCGAPSFIAIRAPRDAREAGMIPEILYHELAHVGGWRHD